MALDKFWLQSNNGKQIDLQNLKELKKSDLGNNNALIQLFNIFDTQKTDGTAGSDGVLNKSELTSLFNTFNAGANSSKGASKSVFESNEAEEYLNTTKTTNGKTLSEIGVKATDLFEFLSKLTQNSNAPVNVNNVANDVHLTEEQAQDEVISIISEDTANARTLLMKQDNGHISQLYNKAKELFDSDLSLSNVEEAFMLQEECLENLSKAKEGKLSKREYFLKNREHLKTMMKRRLFRKDENTGLDFLDNNRGKMSKQEFAKFMEDYINQKINEIDKLDSLNKFQHYLLTMTSSGVNRMLKNYQKAAENKLFIPEAKSVHSKTSSIPQKYNTTEPMTFKEVFEIERNREYSKDRVEAYISQKQKTDFAVGAYNKYQSFKMNSSEILNDYTKLVTGSYVFGGGMAAGVQPNPEKQMQKVLKAFESYYANPIDPNSAKNEIETLIKDNKLPVTVIQISDGKLSLDLSKLKTDTEKNNVLNKLLKLEDTKLEAKLKTTLGGEVDEMLEMLSTNTQIAFTNAYGHDFTNELVQEMSDDNKTVIQRYTGNTSLAGMGLTVVGGVLCFTPLAGVGATMVGIGNAMAIGGMVAESALGFEEALSRSNLNLEEIKELSKTLVMNAGGFVVGYTAGQTGMKAFNKLIDKKLAEVFKTEMANGNRAEALKQVFSNPEYLKNFMQAAGVKLSADFVISYAGDLAMMGILDTNDDWKSLLQSNLIGIMTSMGGDLKDVANLGIKGNKAKTIQKEEKTNNKTQELEVVSLELQDDLLAKTEHKPENFKVERIGTYQNKCGVLVLKNSNGEKVGDVNYDLREVNGQKVLHFEGLKSNISGAGVGSKLIQELVKLSNELGAEGRVVATASPMMSPDGKLTNMGFYYKLGFKATDATKDAEIRQLLAEGKEIPISLNVFTDIELTPEGIIRNTITKQSSLQDVNNNNIKEKFKEKLVEIGVDDIEEQTLLTNFLLDASNIIDRNTQINITNAQLEFLKSKGATFENTYLLAPQPSGPKKLKSYTNATRALLEISNNENSILPLNINNTKCEIGDFQRTIFEQNEQGKKFIVLTDDCSLSGASMLEDSLTKLNSGTNLKTGQNVEIVFVPTVLGTKAVHTINNFIKCYEQLTSSDVVMLEKAIKKKNTENLSPTALQMYHIIEEITDFNSKTPEKDKSSITIAKTIKNAIKTKEKGGNISFSLANVSETYPVQLAQDFRNTLYYQNLSNEKKDIISSWLTADGQSFGYHSSATSVIIEGFDCKYDFMQKIDNKDTQRALGYKEDGTPHNIPLKGNAPNNNVILTQILAEVMGIDKKRIKSSGETFPEIQYKLKQHGLTSIVNQKYQNGMVTSGRAIKIEFAIKPGGNYDGKISILGKTFDSGCKIEVLNKEGTTLFSQQLPNIQPGTSFLEAIPQIRKELNLNNFEDNKATIVHGTKIIDEKYDKPLQYYPGEQENYIIAIPKLESNNIIVKVNGEIIDF